MSIAHPTGTVVTSRANRSRSAAQTAAEYVAHFRRRVVQDALAEATAAYWRRRAAAFENAKPDPVRDYAGAATLDELRDAWVRCELTARACRHRAELGLDVEAFDEDWAEVIGGAA